MRQIIAIHRHGSFGKAAEALSVSQPTLSKSIARLEDELQLKLFDRSGAGAAATPMGWLVVERAQRIIAETQRLERDVELVGTGGIGDLRIGVGPWMRGDFLDAFVETLARQFPALRLQVIVDALEPQMRRLFEGELDLFIGGAGPGTDQVVSVELKRDPIMAVVAPTHPLAGRNSVSVEEFASFPCAGVPMGTGYAIADHAKVTPEAARMLTHFYVSDLGAGISLVAAGLATGYAPQWVFRRPLREGRLVRVPLEFQLEWVLTAYMTAALGHSPVVGEVIEIARKTFDNLT